MQLKFCDRHWHILHQEVANAGLEEHIPRDGQHAVDKRNKGEFDPIFVISSVIYKRTFEIFDDIGEGDDTICPICLGVQRGIADSNTILKSLSTQILTYAKEKGIIREH